MIAVASPADIGARIRQAREALNLSQADLAQASGVPQQSIARYELGKSDPPATAAAKLAKALGISLDDLLADEE